MSRIFAISFLLVAMAVGSCTPSTNPHFKVGNPYLIEGKQYVPNINPKYAEIGIASWYGGGDGFHNELTANGELFDKHDLTAAHRTLPLPSIVSVTNLENGKTIRLRVNDRGPFVKGRIIDVSEKAARRLGFYEKGSAKVLVELDREASLKAADRIRISEDDRRRLRTAYTGIAQDPVAEQTNKEIMVITSALKGQSRNAIPRSMQKNTVSTTTKVKVAAPERISASKKAPVEKIVIREEIVKPAGAAYKTPVVAKKTTEVTSKTVTSDTTEKGIYVQVASVTDRLSASEISRDISRFAHAGIFDAIINGKQYYRVRLGAFDSRSAAEVALNNIKNNGYPDAYIVTEN